MYLLDTDSLSLAMLGHRRVGERRSSVPATEIAITIITRIEVLQGRFASILKAVDGDQLLRAQTRLEENEAFMRTLRMIALDPRAAAEFDRLRRDRKLKRIGRGDLLIAAIALAQRATLVTRNLRHFRSVTGLRIENWAD